MAACCWHRAPAAHECLQAALGWGIGISVGCGARGGGEIWDPAGALDVHIRQPHRGDRRVCENSRCGSLASDGGKAGRQQHPGHATLPSRGPDLLRHATPAGRPGQAQAEARENWQAARRGSVPAHSMPVTTYGRGTLGRPKKATAPPASPSSRHTTAASLASNPLEHTRPVREGDSGDAVSIPQVKIRLFDLRRCRWRRRHSCRRSPLRPPSSTTTSPLQYPLPSASCTRVTLAAPGLSAGRGASTCVPVGHE